MAQPFHLTLEGIARCNDRLDGVVELRDGGGAIEGGIKEEVNFGVAGIGGGGLRLHRDRPVEH